jgi:hypothetical protein
MLCNIARLNPGEKLKMNDRQDKEQPRIEIVVLVQFSYQRLCAVISTSQKPDENEKKAILALAKPELCLITITWQTGVSRGHKKGGGRKQRQFRESTRAKGEETCLQSAEIETRSGPVGYSW